MANPCEAAILVIVGEPFTNKHRELILEKITKGFQCWEGAEAGCEFNINTELGAATSVTPSSTGDDKPYGEKEIHIATSAVQLDVLINPQIVSVRNKLRAFLQAPSKYHHLVFSGHAIQGSGDWILQDHTFSFHQVAILAKEADVEAALKQKSGTPLVIHTHGEGHWTTAHAAKESLGKLLKVTVNPDDHLDDVSGVQQFASHIGNFVKGRSPRELLQTSDVVGNIRFSRPTLYIFPGCQGDTALFGISGFNLLVNGGFSRKSSFWDFTRHLDRIDAMVLTHLGADNLFGPGTMLERKASETIHPEIGHVYINASDKGKHSPNGDAFPENGGSHKPASLLVNLVEEANRMTENIRLMGLTPSPCVGVPSGQTIQPISLYHKVGHGSLDMYILNPFQDSKELKDFFVQWNKHVNNFSNSKMKLNGKDVSIPLPNVVSICALLVWHPSNPNEKISRILFPGNTPQTKIFEGMDKLKNKDIFQHAEVTQKLLTCPKGAKKLAGGKAKPIAKSPPPSRLSPPLSKSDPKKRAFTPTKTDKSQKDAKNKKVTTPRSSKASSTTGSVASAATPTATPVSSVEVSPTKEPAPAIEAPVVAAVSDAVAASQPPAEEKAPEPVKTQDKLVSISPEEPKQPPYDSSPEPVTASVSDKSPDLPPEVPSADLLDFQSSPSKQASTPEDQQTEADLLGSAVDSIPPAETVPITKQVDVIEQASMPEADQTPPVLAPPVADAVTESPEPLPDPAQYEPEKEQVEDFIPQEKNFEAEAQQSDLVKEVYSASQEVEVTDSQKEPDLLPSKPADIMDSTPEADHDIVDVQPVVDESPKSPLQPDVIPKEPETPEPLQEQPDNPEMVDELPESQTKPMVVFDDDKDIDTTEAPVMEKSPEVTEKEIPDSREEHEEESLPEVEVAREEEPVQMNPPEDDICGINQQISQEDYRKKLSDLGIYDDDSELPNGEASPASTPVEEQAAVTAVTAAEVPPSQDNTVFDGEGPVGLPSPEEPPVLLEPECESDLIALPTEPKPVGDMISSFESPVQTDDTVPEAESQFAPEKDVEPSEILAEKVEPHVSFESHQIEEEKVELNSEKDQVMNQELMDNIKSDMESVETNIEKEECKTKEEEFHLETDAESHKDAPIIEIEKTKEKTMDELYEQIRNQQDNKESSPEPDDQDLHAEACGSDDGSSLIDSAPDVYEVEQVQRMELGEEGSQDSVESDEEREQIENPLVEPLVPATTFQNDNMEIDGKDPFKNNELSTEEKPEIIEPFSDSLADAEHAHNTVTNTAGDMSDSLYEQPELQPQPEPQEPDPRDIPSFSTNPFELMDSPHDDTSANKPNPFVNLDSMLEPRTIPDDKLEPAVDNERDSLEREPADAFDPLKSWGQPLGLPAPPPPDSTKPASKANGTTKTGAKKPATSQTKKPATGSAKPAGKPAANGPKKVAVSKDTKKPATKKPPSAGAPKSRPVSAPVPAKPESKAPRTGTKKPASAPKEAPVKPLPPVTPFFVDLTYIPNHGDATYVDINYFRRVRARYYVLSSLDNSPHVLNALLEGKQTWENQDAEVTLIPTYDTETLRSWMVLNRDQLSQLKIDVAPSASRCTIQLQDHETSCLAFRLEF